MTDDDLIWAGKRGVLFCTVTMVPSRSPPVRVKIVNCDGIPVEEAGYSKDAVWERAVKEIDRLAIAKAMREIEQ